jgi:osmotically-inducible protein OsmY
MFPHHAFRFSTLAILGALPLFAARAEHALQSAPEDGQPGAPARDWVHEAYLSLQVQGSLAGRLASDAGRIHVTVRGHDVTLTGQVEKKSSVAEAELAARSVEGVGNVTNRLTLYGDR